MALSKDKQHKLEILVSKGGLSDRAIAKVIPCDPKTVRNYIDKLDLEKSSLKILANEEISIIIKGNEIEEKKSSLSPHQKSAYSEVLLSEAQSQNLALNANHKLLIEIDKDLDRGTKEVKINVGDGIQNLEPMIYEPIDRVNQAKAIQTITDNLGITQRHSNSQVTVNTQTNVNQEVMELTIESMENVLEDFKQDI